MVQEIEPQRFRGESTSAIGCLTGFEDILISQDHHVSLQGSFEVFGQSFYLQSSAIFYKHEGAVYDCRVSAEGEKTRVPNQFKY